MENKYSKYELEEEEAKYIRENKCINIKTPGRTKKEYYEDNKEKLLEKVKEYNENNKDKITEYNKKYNENNKEKMKEYQKEYNENNKDKLKEYKKKYRKENKEKLLEKKKEKITCECGAIVARGGIVRHKRTLKHLKLTTCIIID